ncbi:unnamed protein product [marine sediment metagenome]|uniref:Uncharacterized protein n=1 Tax=marine sediment metagenome TaxID=412755 RepID=X0SRL2_9ZZZZ
MVSQKVGFGEPARRLAGGSVISTTGRNLVFSACYIGKISRFPRNDMLLRLFTGSSTLADYTINISAKAVPVI